MQLFLWKKKFEKHTAHSFSYCWCGCFCDCWSSAKSNTNHTIIIWKLYSGSMRLASGDSQLLPIEFMVVIIVAVVGVIAIDSLGVAGPADCGPGVKPGWLIDFWRTSRIFNCKLCLFGNTWICFIWNRQINSLNSVPYWNVVSYFTSSIEVSTYLEFGCIFWAREHSSCIEKFHN